MPMRLFSTKFVSVSKPVRLTPLPVLPEMTVARVPTRPTKLSVRGGGDGHAVPGIGQGARRLISVPMSTPQTWLEEVMLPEISTPSPPLSEMTSGAIAMPLTTLETRAEHNGHAAQAIAVRAPEPSFPCGPVMSVPMASPSTTL